MITFRASNLGACLKSLVAERLGIEGREPPEAFSGATCPDCGGEAWFGDGHDLLNAAACPTCGGRGKVGGYFQRGVEHEAECLEAMRADGWLIDSEQREVVLPVSDEIQVMGHLDGICWLPAPALSGSYVWEAKAPNAWARFEKAAKTGDWSDALMHKYAHQISVYMLATGLEAVVTCVEDGRVKTFGIETPPVSHQAICERVLYVENVALNGSVGEVACGPAQFPCAFFPQLCDSARVEVAFDPVLDGLAERYEALSIDKKDIESLIKEIRGQIVDRLGDRPTVTTDSAKVTLSTTTRATFDRKAAEAELGDLSRFFKTSESEALRVTRRGGDSE